MEEKELLRALNSTQLSSPRRRGSRTYNAWIPGQARDDIVLYFVRIVLLIFFCSPIYHHPSVYGNFETKPQLLIFVSSSMQVALLKNYYREAAKYGGILVFKGLPNGSFKELGKLIAEMHGDMDEEAGAGSIIDDGAFERFGIINVPAFVLVKEEECYEETSCKVTYDKIVGNIGVRSALLKFEEEGDVGGW